MSVLDILSPVRNYLYAGVAVLAVVGWFYHDHEVATRAVEHERTAVQAESIRVDQAAQRKIDDLIVQHSADVAKIEDTYAAALQTAHDQHAADLQRLRDAALYRATHAVLDGTGSARTEDPSGASGAPSLESVSAELADALRQDDAALGACYADRDALTGK